MLHVIAVHVALKKAKQRTPLNFQDYFEGGKWKIFVEHNSQLPEFTILNIKVLDWSSSHEIIYPPTCQGMQNKTPSCVQFSSVHFSRSVVSDSLRPHELQHARPPCPSPSPGVHSDSHPSPSSVRIS